MNAKKLGKNILCTLLEAQVKRLRKRHQFKVVAVAGSVGKTSTKLAIARTLASKQEVIYQDGNYNDRLTVPLVLFGEREPGIFNIFAWLKILLSNERKLRGAYGYDAAVLEFGTDAPGQLRAFAYLRPDLVVITAIASEHMEFFGSLDKIAAEELAPVSFSNQALLNIDDIPAQFLPSRSYAGYGQAGAATYHLTEVAQHGLEGQKLKLSLDGVQLDVQTPLIGLSIAKSLTAAAAVAHMFGWDPAAIQTGLKSVGHVPGRMQILDGIQGSKLSDDTYNASPIAVRAALDALYQTDASQRIAILGTMNELGATSQAEHASIGAYCKSDKLDLVVTIGRDAEQYLVPAAVQAGFAVKSFMSPAEAGAYVKEQLKEGAVVLAKGSQNGVFAEEALKPLLRNPDDSSKLVRQSPYWLSVKKKQFLES